jgi:hypothetical protein
MEPTLVTMSPVPRLCITAPPLDERKCRGVVPSVVASLIVIPV